MHGRLGSRFAIVAGVTVLALGVLAAPAAAHGGHGHGGGHAFSGAHGQGGGDRGGGGSCGCRGGSLVSLDVVASALGVTTAQLQADLKSGKTLAQQAAAAGKSVDTVATAVTTAAKSALDAAVAAGSLNTGQAQAVLLGVPQQVTNLVTATAGKLAGGKCGLLRLDIGFAASALGVTVAQLRADLAAGKTLAAIAAAAGKTISGLLTTAADSAKSTISSAVSAGSLTSSQGTSLTTTVSQTITSVVGGALGK